MAGESATATATAKPVIFISYSHKDEPEKPAEGEVRWRTYVQSHLQPAVKNGIFDLWVDHDIDAGADWRAEIEKKLNTCDISVLLVSRHALSSDFILDVEVKRLLERRQSDGLPIYPIVLSAFAKATVPWLTKMNLRPREGRALASFALADRDTKMAEIVDEIATLAQSIAQRKQVSAEEQAQRQLPFATFTMSDILPSDLEKILDGLKSEGHEAIEKIQGGAGSWILRIRSKSSDQGSQLVDVGHLPETAYERLVGRDEELKLLDEAWGDAETNIISLVAEGGAGKSALVNEWLKRAQTENYRGAEAVLGWSFYSQGSKERATAADAFLDWALEKLGVTLDTTSASAKGEAIAETIAKRRVLLVLDGVEPLQHGPGPQLGQLKDLGLRALLRRFAAAPPAQGHGLVVATSRLAIADIARWKDTAAPVVDLEQLSDEVGTALLRDNGVWGTDRELKAASHDFGGHPLALGLLASFLKQTQFGDVRRRDRIRAWTDDPENPNYDHAKRVMESYEKDWLIGQPELMAIMHMVGLFDRPASGDCLRVLREYPPIQGFPHSIVELSDDDWNRAVTRLREARLLAPADSSIPDMLDAHPLVREWFGEQFRHRGGWRVAHGRLYAHLRDTTREGRTPTLENLAPLYQAIAHGCRAGLYQAALDQVYRDRILRRHRDGRLEFYASRKLGVLGSNLAAISWFFAKPYGTPIETIKERDRASLLREAAAYLRALGRFGESLPVQRALLKKFQVVESRKLTAKVRPDNIASDLSQMELLVGEVAAADATAKHSVQLADRDRNKLGMVVSRAMHANVLHAAGRRGEAEQLFALAEQRKRELFPTRPELGSVTGYYDCDLLLAKRNWLVCADRASRTIERSSYLLDAALFKLVIGRAHMGIVLEALSHRERKFNRAAHAQAARSRMDAAVDGLRTSSEIAFIPTGLLARAAFRRSAGDWPGAVRDLDEVEEIAEPGPMRLYLGDMALERARLCFARIEAFAPLNGMLENDNPPQPERPGEAEIAKLREEAAERIKIAAGYIETCGYHRRDEELAELQAVLRNEKTFAELPPRV